MRDAVRYYVGLGWSLCATRAEDNKVAYGREWESRGRPAKHWDDKSGDGVGLIHGLSGTCAVDIDNLEHARVALAAIGVSLDELMADPNAVQITSGREGRAKLMYRLPPGAVLKRHALFWPLESDDSKNECIVEFRAGSTHDVLPPSIHPETRREYEWIGDPASMPTIPDALLSAWENWPITRALMADACPWATRYTAPAYTPLSGLSTGGTGRSVIQEFNAQVCVESLLDRHGYKRAGARWFAPASKSGTPGVVVFLDGHKPLVYSHHGSDPLGDGHAHDAFSIFCVLDHRGDVTAAVKDAAGLLGIVEEIDPAVEEFVDSIILKAAKSKEVDAASEPTATIIPMRPIEQPEPVSAPSVGAIPVRALDDAWKWSAAQMHAVKPDALTQAVLSLACALTARRYVTFDGQPSTTFFGVTDTSVAGLRPMKATCYRLAVGVGERQMLRGTKIPSSGVLYAALLRSPRMYWVTDEYGHIVQMARRQQSGALESAIAVLHEAYTGQTMFIDPDTATFGSKQRALDECDIYAPSVTLLAMLSNDHISALGMRSEYGRGTLQQMLVVPAGDLLPGHYADPVDEVPATFERTARQLAPSDAFQAAMDTATLMPSMITVPWERAAGDVASEVRARLNEYISDPSRQNWRGMVHGYMQSAIRIATALAAWENPATPVVTADLMRWACLWVERCLRLTMPRLEIASTDTDEPDVMQRVQEILFAADGPMTSREIARRCRPFSRLSRDAKEDLLQSLIDDGALIVEDSDRTRKYLAKIVERI